MITNPIRIRRRTPFPSWHTLSSLSLGPLAEARPEIPEAHQQSCTSIWRWVQRSGPNPRVGADPRDAHRIFIDEAMVSVGGTPAWIWVAFEPDPHAMLDFHAARAGTP
jgi:transposase-like protein